MFHTSSSAKQRYNAIFTTALIMTILAQLFAGLIPGMQTPKVSVHNLNQTATYLASDQPTLDMIMASAQQNILN